MKTRIHFQPGGQVENLGDQLTNLATINALRPFGEVIVNDLSSPAWFIDSICTGREQRYSEIARGRYFATLVISLIRQKFSRDKWRNYFVLPPGHSSRKGFRQARVVFFWYARLLLLRLLGCKVVRAGFSIGPFDRLNGWVESLGSRAFAFYGVRDRESFALASRFRCSNVHYFPDLAWSYVPSGSEVSRNQKDGPVVLSFRSNAYGVLHSTDYLRPIRQRLSKLLAMPALAGKRVIVAYQVQADCESSRELFDDLSAKGIAVELREKRLSMDEAANLYADAYCVISNRLHVLLLAAQSRALPVPLADAADNVKITSILRDNGLAEIVIDLQGGDVASMARLEAILAARDDILKKIAQARESNVRGIELGLHGVFGCH